MIPLSCKRIFTSIKQIHLASLQIHYKFSIDNKSSRQIQKKMLEQKFKHMQNYFKSLQTQFGLKKPTQVKQKYEKPPTIDFTLQSLRNCSREYPQYLNEELKNPNSQFYKVINKNLDQLWKADKQQALQFLEFIYKWELNDKGLTKRYLQRLEELNLFEIFNIIKWWGYNPTMQNLLIRAIKDIRSQEYQVLFKIINYLRLKDYGSESFFKGAERLIKENLDSIPPSTISSIAVHYALNSKQQHDTRINILKLLQTRIIKIIQFLSHDQLLSVIYCYLRADLLTRELLEIFVSRLQQNYSQFENYNKKKFFTIISILPMQQRFRLLSKAISDYMQRKVVHYDYAVDFLLNSFESGLITKQFAQSLQLYIIENILNMKPEEVSKCMWVFFRTAQDKHCKMLADKMEIIIEGGLRQYNIKQISSIVYGLALIDYKPNAQFWNNIQYKLQQLLAKEQNRNLSNCSYILWAYLNNRLLQIKTIRNITAIIKRDQQSINTFELINFISFYYSLDPSVKPFLLEIKPILLRSFNEIYQQMTITEIIKCYRYLHSDISQQMFQNILEHVDRNFQEITYQECLTLLGLLMMVKNPTQLPIKQSLVVKLAGKIKQMESIKKVDAQIKK